MAEGMGWAVGLFAWVRRPGDEGEMAEAGDYRRLQANGESCPQETPGGRPMPLSTTVIRRRPSTT